MTPTMMAVAEQLADEYRDTEPATVARVVCECLDAFPEVDPWFIEQASRARLARTAGGR